MTHSSNDSRGNGSSLLPGRILREPLVHFLALAGLLFLAQALLRGDQREPIHIDLATQQFLVQQEANLSLRPLTEQERQTVIGSFVDEEILFREAKKRGFENSSRVRRLLVQNMRFFLASDPPAPTEAELRAYFTDNPDAFSSPATLTLENVFFVDPASITPTILERLKAGAGPGQLGDDTPVTEFRLYSMDHRRLAAYFGPEGAPQVLEIEDEDWHGPVPSPRGTHFVRIVQRTEPETVGFEESRRWVEASWKLRRQREAVEQALDEMRQNYRVVLEQPDPQGESDGDQ